MKCKNKGCKTILAFPKSTTNAKKHLKSHKKMFFGYEAKQLIFEKETKTKVIKRKTKKRDDSNLIKIDDAFKKFYSESSNR